MNCRLIAGLLCASLVLAVVHPKRAGGATPAEVEAAIQKAKKYFYAAQNPAGNWETSPAPDGKGGMAGAGDKQWGGYTSMVTYALLAAGDDIQHQPKLVKPLAFLGQADIVGIYATGLRCQVWFLVGSDEDKKFVPAITRDRDTLLTAVHQPPMSPEVVGYYFYYLVPKGPQVGGYDRSVSQYGVLGTWALEQAGVEIPLKYWSTVDGAWRRCQNLDGGWSYSGNAGAAASTATMTAAGIATLFITQDYTMGNLAECKGNIVNTNIEKGLTWMDKHINEALNSGNFYGMYGIERIGVASGRKYFETVDWYQQGADFIVKHQGADGSWGAISDTSFCLLFLVRGRAPVVMNKLEYEILDKGKVAEGPWNERPRDCANFTHYIGRNLEQTLNWQIVNLKVAPEELHDAPILYISGNKELVLADSDIKKLRAFVEQGGMILGNADCGTPAFTKSFEKLGAKLFPKYEFRDLQPSHTIFTNEQFPAAKWKVKPRVRGLSNSVRELMLVAPEIDMSRAFQGRNEKVHMETYQLAADIFLYAVDKKNLRKKGETYIVKDDPAVKTTRAATLVRLEAGDNWNPEPDGWRRMQRLLHNQDQVALTVKEAKIDPAGLKGAKLAHLTGTTSFKLSPDQRAALKDFVEAGGTLIVDCAAGNADFALSAETELSATFGHAPETLSLDSQVYRLPGLLIDEVHYRMFSRTRITGAAKSPRIKGIDVKGRLAVFYSREDLSAALVGEPVDGIIGYEPASATALMRNIILFGAFGFPKPPASQPTTRPVTQPTTKPATAPTTIATTQPTAVPATAPAVP